VRPGHVPIWFLRQFAVICIFTLPRHVYGRNALWRLVASQLSDPLIVVLMAAAVLTVTTGDWTDASVIVLVIVVNTAVGVAQELKAGQAIAALSELAAPEARVLRDGEQRVIPAAEVVVGDLLVLAEGDIMPADADIVDSAALLVDESTLTGESVPVDKTAVRQGPIRSQASARIRQAWTPSG
jgi:P-type Ca2+ transporter type 2C